MELPTVTDEMLTGTVPLIEAVTLPICDVLAPSVTVPAPIVTTPMRFVPAGMAEPRFAVTVPPISSGLACSICPLLFTIFETMALPEDTPSSNGTNGIAPNVCSFSLNPETGRGDDSPTIFVSFGEEKAIPIPYMGFASPSATTEGDILSCQTPIAVTVPAIVWVDGRLEIDTTLPLTALRISVIA